MAEVTTNFRDSSQGDLGKNLVSKEYLTSVYPKIADQILQKNVYIIGQVLDGICPTGAAVTPRQYRYAGLPNSSGFLSEWKCFAEKGNLTTGGIKNNGTLWTWGKNIKGSIGNITSVGVVISTPIQEFTSSTNWKQLTFSTDYLNERFWAAAIKTDGTLWTWGSNENLGLGVLLTSSAIRSTPLREHTSSTNWKKVSCTQFTTIAIKTDGTLWGWGNNRYSTLGTGNPVGIFFALGSRNTPIRIGTKSDWKDINAGDITCMALDSQNNAYGWGYNQYEALGTKVFLYMSSPTSVVSSSVTWKTPTLQKFPDTFSGMMDFAAISNDGRLLTWGENRFGSVADLGQLDAVTGLSINASTSSPRQEHTFSTNWKQVCVGTHVVSGLKTDNTLWTWGWSESTGRLGRITGGLSANPSIAREFTSSTNWKQIASNSSSFLATKLDGTLWGWGGRLGGYSNLNVTIPTQITATSDWDTPLPTDGSAYMALKTDGTLWLWGANSTTRLGINDNIYRSTPVQEWTSSTWITASGNDNTTAAIKTDGTLWLWGRNTSGQLSRNDIISRSTPVQEWTSSTNWKQVACSGDSIYAIKNDGTLWVWGKNGIQGFLGTNSASTSPSYVFARSTPVREFTSSSNWIAVTAKDQLSNFGHTVIAMKSDGSLWVWGSNNTGSCGIDNRTILFTPTKEQTSSQWKKLSCADSARSYGLKQNGTVWAFGDTFTSYLASSTSIPIGIKNVSLGQLWANIGNDLTNDVGVTGITVDGKLYYNGTLVASNDSFTWGKLYPSSYNYTYLMKY